MAAHLHHGCKGRHQRPRGRGALQLPPQPGLGRAARRQRRAGLQRPHVLHEGGLRGVSVGRAALRSRAARCGARWVRCAVGALWGRRVSLGRVCPARVLAVTGGRLLR